MGSPMRALRNVDRVTSTDAIKTSDKRRKTLKDQVDAQTAGDTVHDASKITFDPSGTNLSSTTVQAALASLAATTSSWSSSNASTSRSIDADDAAGTISATPTQAEVENVRDAVLALADYVATLVSDLKTNGILS